MTTLDCLHKHNFFFTFVEEFLLHARGVTRNWCIYFTSVWRVFLVETVILQTVLWDIWAWSARFLVFIDLFFYAAAVEGACLICYHSGALCGRGKGLVVTFLDYVSQFFVVLCCFADGVYSSKYIFSQTISFACSLSLLRFYYQSAH